MYSRNCGKSRTDTKSCECYSALPARRRTGRLGIQIMCDFQVQTLDAHCFCWEVHENIAATPCIGIASESKTIPQSTVFSVAVPCRDIKRFFRVTACVKFAFQKFLAKNNMHAKNPTKERSLLSSSFLPTVNNLHSKQLSTPKNLFSTVSVSS
jgi:hypothetical protein